MVKTLELRLRIRRDDAVWLLTLALLLTAAGETASESITLSTYYPAPLGVYASLITTGSPAASPTNTILVRDYGKVGIGTALPQQSLSVSGGLNVDQASQNTGFLNQNGDQGSGLSFGSNSGEGIASKRSAGGNQYGLDFYTGFNDNLSISNGGQVSAADGLNVDQADQNGGFLNQNGPQGNGLSFGAGSGEGIASQRSPGANQFGLDFYTGFSKRMWLTQGGDATMQGNLTVNDNVYTNGSVVVGNNVTVGNSLTLGGVPRSSWPQIQTQVATNQQSANDNAWTSVSVSCPAGTALVGCSGYYNEQCFYAFSGYACMYAGAFPSGNGCQAEAYTTGHGSTLYVYAYCASVQ